MFDVKLMIAYLFVGATMGCV